MVILIGNPGPKFFVKMTLFWSIYEKLSYIMKKFSSGPGLRVESKYLF